MTVRTTKTFPFTPKRKPPMVEIGGFLFQFFKGGPAFRLTAQVLPIQPFANVVRNYTATTDNKNVQNVSIFAPPSWGKADEQHIYYNITYVRS